MKRYENISRIQLTRRMPVIIRIDGKAFHTFTKGFQRPFDAILMTSMADTAKYLCENVMNCKLAYTQSDEISLLLVDYGALETQAWFDNGLQKMTSVAASMATMSFNRSFLEHAVTPTPTDADDKLLAAYSKKALTAMFDARVFVLPREEVCNYFIWRQQDAVRNSIQMLAQSMFSHKELHGKSVAVLQDMMREKGVNWNDLPVIKKHGHCVVKETFEQNGALRSRWVSDHDTPVFSKYREYIERHVNMI